MSDERDRIEQIRSRRSRQRIDAAMEQQAQVQQRIQRPAVSGPAVTRGVAEAGEAAAGIGAGAPTPWMQDRVTLSLEAQIAMIEMRAAYKLTLADMGYHNRLQILAIRPGIFLKVEPTGCYRMAYHNRV